MYKQDENYEEKLWRETLSVFCVDEVVIEEEFLVLREYLIILADPPWVSIFKKRNELSGKAKAELKEILAKELGADIADDFSDEELNKLGLLFLNILAENLKMKAASPELSAPPCR